MQRIANLLAIKDGKVLLATKTKKRLVCCARRQNGKWRVIYESAIREFQEETNVTPKNVHLKGTFTMVIKDR